MTKHFINLLVFTLFFTIKVSSQEIIEVQRLDDLWQMVKEQNYTFKTQAIEKEKAELTYKTSLGNVFNPRMPVQVNFVDNTRLPVNLIPAEIFGGPQGVFREVVFGQQYNTLFNFQPQFDIFNMSAIGQIKSARLQQRLIDNQNLLNEYILHEKVNAIYHNIVSLKAQKSVLQKNNEIAQQILTIVVDRYEEGLIRKQEINEAQVNTITMEDNIEQLSKMIESQEYELALLVQNKIFVSLPDVFDEILVAATTDINIAKNELKKTLMDFQLSMLRQDIKNLKYQYYPTLSFVSAFNWQNLSNDFFLASNSTSFHYNNIGLRLSWDLPTVTRLSTTKNKQYQLETFLLERQQIEDEADTHMAQLKIDYEKARSQWGNYRKISLLKVDSYQRYLDQYQENILPLDRLLLSQTDMLSSQLNEIKAQANVAYSYHKILINNQYQK